MRSVTLLIALTFVSAKSVKTSDFQIKENQFNAIVSETHYIKIGNINKDSIINIKLRHIKNIQKPCQN